MLNKIESAAGGIVTKYDVNAMQVLILLVQANKQHGGHWGFPKGHVEINESLLATAVREIHEETGITVKVQNPQIFWQNIYKPTLSVTKTVTYFWFKPVTLIEPLVLQKSEIAKAAWIDLKQAKKILTFASDVKILETFESYLKTLIKF